MRGFRIELGEIEAALAAHPGVREAAVVGVGEAGRRPRLVAYVVPRGAGGAAAEPRRCGPSSPRRLPAYMVPGGLRRARRPAAHAERQGRPPGAPRRRPRRAAAGAPEAEGGRARRRAAPVEEVLAGLWAELLGLAARSAPTTTSSPSAATRSSPPGSPRGCARRFGVELPLRAALRGADARRPGRRASRRRWPPARGPARAAARPGRAGRRRGRCRSPSPRSGSGSSTSSTPGSAAYNIPAALRLARRRSPRRRSPPPGARSSAATRRCAPASPRSTAGRSSGSIRSIRRPRRSGAAPRPAARRPRGAPAGRRRGGGARAAPLAAEARRPFDLAARAAPAAPRLSCGWAPRTTSLPLTLHHIVADGWSIGVLVRELGALYGAFAAGRPSPLPPLPVQYADFAAWQRGWLARRGARGAARLLARAARRRAAAPRAARPTGRAPPVQTFRGGQPPVACRRRSPAAPRTTSAAARGRHALHDPPRRLRRRSSRASRGQDDLVVGSPVAGRDRAEIEGLIGFFVNTLVLRADLAAAPASRELLAGARETALGAFAHQDLPFEQLVDELPPEREPRPRAALPGHARPPEPAPSRPALRRPRARAAAGDRHRRRRSSTSRSTWARQAGGLAGSLEYNSDLFDAATAARWRGAPRDPRSPPRSPTRTGRGPSCRC